MEERRFPRRAYPGPTPEKRLPRMRTAANVVKEIKAMDPGSNVSEHWVRQIAKSGRVPVVRAGRKILINLDEVLELLNAGDDIPAPTPAPVVELKPEPPRPAAPQPPKARGIRRIEV